MAGKGRREKGTGTVYQRDNGSWVGRVTIGKTPDGKIKTKSFSGKTEAEVKKKIREFCKTDYKEEKKSVSLQTYITNWLTNYKRTSLKPSSYDRLEITINTHIIPALGMIPINQVTSDDIQALITKLKQDNKSHSSVKKVYDALNAVMRHATIHDDIVKNPMLLVAMPEKSLFEQKEIRYFTTKEVAAITEEVQRKYNTGRPVYAYGDVYMLMLNTGIRVGELAALKKQDWNVEERTLHVQRTAQIVKVRDSAGIATGGRQLVLSTTKTYSGDRYIPLNKNALEALERLSEVYPNSEFLVCNEKGENVSPAKIERAFERVVKRLGLEKAGTHSLRHTFASMLFAKGVDVKTVSKLLGHANIQITLNTYIHLIDKADHKAVVKLDDVF